MEHQENRRHRGFTIFDALPEEQRKELMRRFGVKDRRNQEADKNKHK